MTKVYPLCSSSKGNCTYIGTDTDGILVDIGVGPRIFEALLRLQGIDISAIKAIFITHEHSDHISGLSQFLKRHNVPVYGSKETLTYLIDNNYVFENSDLNEINLRSAYAADMEISAFSTPHDSLSSQGYEIVTPEQKKLCICTDLGYMPDDVYSRLCGSEFVLLESNYDEMMLSCGDYPQFLKQRILSSHGHLSNRHCSEVISRLVKDGTKQFLLGHLSEQNNRPDIAFSQTRDALFDIGACEGADYSLWVAEVRSGGECFCI